MFKLEYGGQSKQRLCIVSFYVLFVRRFLTWNIINGPNCMVVCKNRLARSQGLAQPYGGRRQCFS